MALQYRPSSDPVVMARAAQARAKMLDNIQKAEDWILALPEGDPFIGSLVVMVQVNRQALESMDYLLNDGPEESISASIQSYVGRLLKRIRSRA